MTKKIKVILSAYIFCVTVTVNHGVLLSEIGALTFRSGEYTVASSRTKPIKQLQCNGDFCSEPGLPSTAQCQNVGMNEGNANWKCEAELPEGLGFSTAVVLCEGLKHPDDAEILSGSCGLRYTLQASVSYRRQNKRGSLLPGLLIGWVMVFGLALCVRASPTPVAGFGSGAALGYAVGVGSHGRRSYGGRSFRRSSGFGGTIRR